MNLLVIVIGDCLLEISGTSRHLFFSFHLHSWDKSKV